MSFAPALAMTAVSAASQYSQGRAAASESEYNAQLYEKKAEQIDVQKRIEASQYDRAIRKTASTTMAAAGKANIGPGGSTAAVLVDTLTQMEYDKAIGQYNLEVDKRFTMSTADAYKRQAKYQKKAAFTNAFSTVLMGTFQAGTRAGWFGGSKSSTPWGSIGGSSVKPSYGSPNDGWVSGAKPGTPEAYGINFGGGYTYGR